MKYEIIKGSEKDFEGAPEWCTHVSKSTSSGDLAWEMSSVTKDGNKYSWVDEFSGYGVYENASGMKLNIIAERRPITEPVVNQQLTTEWDGTWLPPVGCHCEVKTGKDSWNLCKIVFSDDVAGVAFVYLGGDEENYVGSVDCVGANAARDYFRVMRSPEDVARDEFIKELSGNAIEGFSISTQFAAALYDAGYRKTPTVSELMRVTEKATREDCEAIVKMLGGVK